MPFQSQYTELPNFAQAQLKDILERSQSYGQSRYERPPESRVEPLTPEILESHRLARTRGESYRPYLQQNEELVRRASRDFPQEIERYMNPYQQRVLDRIAEEGHRNFQEKFLPELESSFVRGGQGGSMRHQEYARRLSRDMQNEILGRQAQALASGYQQSAQIFSADQARRLEAAREMGSLAASTQAGLAGEISLLGEQGRYLQQQRQAEREERFQERMRQINFPWEQLEREAAIFQGTPSPASMSTYYERPAVAQMNIPGQAGQLAASILGARLAGGK